MTEQIKTQNVPDVDEDEDDDFEAPMTIVPSKIQKPME